jgi:hypothetical protein
VKFSKEVAIMAQPAIKEVKLAEDPVCKECSWWEMCMTLPWDNFVIQHDSCAERDEPFYVPA